ncbi:MBG domain-containing protein [Lacticaseibacillus jixiensis]|uniref:MBG domain-containing protein n=1 Tax=Lacticaseibacillus jixiensis TaxID=3231926 RepID=UPI0036F2EE60
MGIHKTRRDLTQDTLQRVYRVQMYKIGKLWATTGVSVLFAAGVWTMGPQAVQAADEAGVQTTAVTDQDATTVADKAAADKLTVTASDGPKLADAATTEPTPTTAAPDASTANDAVEPADSPATGDSPVQQTAVITVGTTKKTYDAKASTPLNYTVQLPAGIKAPSGWYVATPTGKYQVPVASGDLNVAAVSQDVGEHPVTLSDAGLARLQAANPGFTFTVKAGNLTIVPASVAAGAVKLAALSKDQGQADPTSYQVTIDPASKLQAPASWAANADGSYTIATGSGDLDLSAISQNPGRYSVTLSQQGLAALAAANPNYALNANAVTAGSLTVQSIAKAVVASSTVAQNAATPKTFSVTIMDAADYVVPADWTKGYTNTGQTSQIYNVPAADFDTSQVDLTKTGKYPLTLNTATIDALNAANPKQPLSGATIEAGKITVVVSQQSKVSINPSNFGVTFPGTRLDLRKLTGDTEFSYRDGQPMQGYVVSRRSALTLSASVLGYNFNGKTVTDLTEFLILPAGFLIGQPTADGDVLVADAPAQVLQEQLITSLKAAGVTYTNLTVTQLADYNRRQTFALQFAQAAFGNTAQFHVVADPNATVKDGFIGAHAATPDSAALYATDDPAYTKGAYTLGDSGYTSNQTVATALGVRNAYTLTPGSYDNINWVSGYTFVDAPVQDTYRLVAPDQTVLDQVTTTGRSGSVYDVMAKLPQTLTHDGQVYEIDPSRVALTQTYPKATATLTSLDAVAPGNTYTVQYLAQLAGQGAIDDQTMSWHDNAVPEQFTLHLPQGLKPADGWVANDDGSYTVATASGDLLLAEGAGAVGEFSVGLSDSGLAKLAAANPEELFDNGVVAAGKLTITSTQAQVEVRVQDTNDHQLQAPQTLSFTIPATGTFQSLVIAPSGYDPAVLPKQLHGLTVVARDGSTNQVMVNADNTLTITRADGSQSLIKPEGSASEYLYQQISNSESALTFAGQVQNTLDASAQNASGAQTATATIIVTFNSQLSGTVVFHNDTDNVDVALAKPLTFTGFAGEAGTLDIDLSQLGLADDYALASGQAATISYTLADGTNQIVVHLIKRQTATLTLNVLDTSGQTLTPPQSVTLNSPGIGRAYRTLVVAPAGYDAAALSEQIHEITVEARNGDTVNVVANADGTVTMRDPDGTSQTVTPPSGSPSAYLYALVSDANALITFGNQAQHAFTDTDQALSNLATLPRAVTVVYNAAVTGTVVFHDDLNHVDVAPSDALTYAGFVGQSGSVTVDLKALGLATDYALATGQATTIPYTLADNDNQIVVHLVKRQTAAVTLNVVNTAGKVLAPAQSITLNVPGNGSAFKSLVVAADGYDAVALKEQLYSVTFETQTGAKVSAVANADHTVTVTNPDGTSETITPDAGSASAYLYKLFSQPDSLITFQGQTQNDFTDTDQAVVDLIQVPRVVTVVYNTPVTGTVVFHDDLNNADVAVADAPTFTGFVGQNGNVTVDLGALGLDGDYALAAGQATTIPYTLADNDNQIVVHLVKRQTATVTLNVVDTAGKVLAPAQSITLNVPGNGSSFQSLVVSPAGYDDTAVKEQLHSITFETQTGAKVSAVANADHTVTVTNPDGTSETITPDSGSASAYLYTLFSQPDSLITFQGQAQNDFTDTDQAVVDLTQVPRVMTVVYNAAVSGAVVFHDDLNNEAVDVEKPLTYQGFVGETDSVEVDLNQLGLADNYALATGQATTIPYTLADNDNQIVVHLIKRQTATVTLNVVDTAGKVLAPAQSVTLNVPGNGNTFQSLVVSPAGYDDTAMKEQLHSITFETQTGAKVSAVANADHTVTVTNPDGTSETITPDSGSASAYLYTLFSQPDSLITFQGQAQNDFTDTDQAVVDLTQVPRVMTVVYNAAVTGRVIFHDDLNDADVAVADAPTYAGFVGQTGQVTVDLADLGLVTDYALAAGQTTTIPYTLTDNDNQIVVHLVKRQTAMVTLNVVDTTGESLAPAQSLTLNVPGNGSSFKSLVVAPAGYDDTALQEQIASVSFTTRTGNQIVAVANADNTVTFTNPDGSAEVVKPTSGSASAYLYAFFSTKPSLITFRDQAQNDFTDTDQAVIDLDTVPQAITVVYRAIQQATVMYLDTTTDAVLQVVHVTGLPNTTSAYRTDATRQDFIDQGYEVIDDNYPTAGMIFDDDSTVDQAYTVNLAHRIVPLDSQDETLQRTVTRTIHFVRRSDGAPMRDDVVQSVTLTRSATQDAVTQAVTYGAWGSGAFDEFYVPFISGYSADQSVVQSTPVTADSENVELTIIYTAVPTGGTGTPTTGGSIGTPTTGGSTGTPTTGDSTGTPTTGDNGTGTPTSDGGTGTSTSDGSTGTPTTGDNSTGTPTSDGSTGTPTTGDNSTGTPTSDGSTGTPTTGDNSTGTPTSNDSTGTPTTGDNSTGTPTSDGGTGTPTSNGSTGTPTTGSSTGTPTNGGSSGTPTSNDSTGTPTTGDNSTGTPTSDGGTGTPTSNGSTGTPTTGSSTGTPTNGGSSGTPTSGGSTSTPSNVGSSGPSSTGSDPRITLPAADGDPAKQTPSGIIDPPTDPQPQLSNAAPDPQSRQTLPQTGEYDTSGLAFVGLALASLLGLSVTTKRRKD